MGRKQLNVKKIMSHICYHSTIIFSFSWAVQNNTVNSKISDSLEWNRTSSSKTKYANYTLNKNNSQIRNYTLDKNASITPVSPVTSNNTAHYNIMSNLSESSYLTSSTLSTINLVSSSTGTEPKFTDTNDLASSATEPILKDKNKIKLDYITVTLTSELSSQMEINISGSYYSCVTIDNGGPYDFASDDFLASETFIDDENATDIFYYDIQDIPSTIAPPTISKDKYSETPSMYNFLPSKPAQVENPSYLVSETTNGSLRVKYAGIQNVTIKNITETNLTYSDILISPSN